MLAGLWPGQGGRVALVPGGSEAVEIAMMAARAHSGRHKFVSFYDAYHGSTMGALSLGGRGFDKPPRLGPYLPDTLHVAPYYPLVHNSETAEAAADRSLRALQDVFANEPDIAAVFAEPIRMTPFRPPNHYWSSVRGLCDKYGALLVFDEIPSGLGKTGALFASELVGATPDITVIGNALGGAVLPLAAVICANTVQNLEQYELEHFTHSRNPVLSIAGPTTLQVIQQEGLVERAAAFRQRVLDDLHDLTTAHTLVSNVRGVGLLLCIEFVSDPQRTQTLAARFRRLAFERGLILPVQHGRSARMTLPLVTTEENWTQAKSILNEALRALDR